MMATRSEEGDSMTQLTDTRLSRRGLIQSAVAAGGLMIVWNAREAVAMQASTPVATPVPAPEGRVTGYDPPGTFTFDAVPQNVDSYLKVNEDGSITLATGKVEFGQGIRTGFMQLAAEELSVPVETITTIMGETDKVPFDIGTFGSLSTQYTGPVIRGAAATMREWLKELGATELGVAVEEVDVENGEVFVIADTAKRVDYATLAAGKTAMRDIAADVPLKDPSTYTIVGQPIHRVDVPSKVNGTMIFGIDSQIEGMVYGKLIRPPALGATLVSIDFSAAEAMEGVLGTYVDGDFAGLIAERYEQAEAAAKAVVAEWTEVNTGITHENVHDLIVRTADEGINWDGEEGPGDPDSVLVTLKNPIKNVFKTPYVNHMPIEPKNAVVSVTEDGAEVWTSTQSPFDVRTYVATELGLPVDAVIVHAQAPGGAFGSKIIPRAEVEAARLSKHFGKPVRILWRREEEFQYAQYRPATYAEISTGLDENGRVAAWKYDLYYGGYYPENATVRTDSASDWSANIAEIYSVPEVSTWLYAGQSPLPPFYWRVNGAAANSFAREVTLNQLAEEAGLDPVTFRVNHLQENPRLLAVLNKAVESAGWTPGVGSTGQGYGVAVAIDANSFVAEVVKVSVDEETGAVTIHEVHAAVDPGLLVNPSAATRQVEGSIVLSTSPALYEAIEFENGKVTNNMIGLYGPTNMGTSPREITVNFISDPTQPMGGLGEPAVAPMPGAIANAIYDAIGVYLYELPMRPENILAAIAERDGATPTA